MVELNLIFNIKIWLFLIVIANVLIVIVFFNVDKYNDNKCLRNMLFYFYVFVYTLNSNLQVKIVIFK
jgi:hypothetical protein